MTDLSQLTNDELLKLYAEQRSKVGDIWSTKEEAPAPRAAKPVSVGEDIAKSAAIGVPEAAVGIATMPGNLVSLGDLARGSLNKYLPDWMVKADAAMRNLSPSTLLGRASPIPGASPQFTGAKVQGDIEQVTGPWYKPQTAAGRFANTAVQTGVGMGKNWITNPATSALLTGMMTGGTEAGGALTDQSPWGRLLGGLVGGAGPTIANATKSVAGKTVANVLGLEDDAMRMGAAAPGSTVADKIAAAREYQAQAEKVGMKALGTESFDRGHLLASYLNADPISHNIIQDVVRNRPQQFESGLKRYILDKTGPEVTPVEASVVAKSAATKIIEEAQKKVTNTTSPLYKAAAKDIVPQKDLREVADKARAIAASDQTGLITPFVGNYLKNITATQETPFIAGKPGKMGKGGEGWIPGTPDVPAQSARYVNDIENLDTVRQYWRDRAMLPELSPEAIPKKTSAKIASVNTLLDEKMAQASPTWDSARDLHQRLMQEKVEPLIQGPVGTLAGRQGFDPSAPVPTAGLTSVLANKDARPETIRGLHRQLNSVDRTAFPGVAQTYFRNQANDALQANLGGTPSTAGAKFALSVYGEPNKREVFRETMRGVAEATGHNPADVVRGAETFMKVLERTGKTPGIGSETHGRGAIAKDLSQSLLGSTMTMLSLTPLRPVGRKIIDMSLQRRSEQIARALTAPDAVGELVKLAKYEPNSVTASFYVAAMLGSGATDDQQYPAQVAQ